MKNKQPSIFQKGFLCQHWKKTTKQSESGDVVPSHFIPLSQKRRESTVQTGVLVPIEALGYIGSQMYSQMYTAGHCKNQCCTDVHTGNHLKTTSPSAKASSEDMVLLWEEMGST